MFVAAIAGCAPRAPKPPWTPVSSAALPVAAAPLAPSAAPVAIAPTSEAPTPNRRFDLGEVTVEVYAGAVPGDATAATAHTDDAARATVPACHRPSGCDGDLQAVRFVVQRRGVPVAVVPWETSIWAFDVAVDPEGRYLAVREETDVARVDLETGRIETRTSPFRGLDYDANDHFGFSARDGALCTRQNGLYHVVFGPTAAEGRAVLCFPVARGETAAEDETSQGQRVELVDVPITKGAHLVPPSAGKFSLVQSWIRSDDGADVAYVDMVPDARGPTYSLVVTGPGARAPRFRVPLAKHLQVSEVGIFDLRILFQAGRVTASYMTGLDAPSVSASFDRRTGKRLSE